MPTLVYRDTGVLAHRMRQESPTSVYPTATGWGLEAVVGSHFRTFGSFPMAPPGGTVTVTSAILTLFNVDARATTRTVQLRKLLSPWTTTHATWNNRVSGVAWNVAGVLTGTDVDATVLATGTCPTTANTSFNLTGAGFNTYCQDILNGATDYGIILNLIDDLTVDETGFRNIAGPLNATAANRPTLTIEYTTGTPVNWTINSPTVNSDAGTATVVLTLDAPAGAGGVNGFFSTYDITATAGADYTARTAVPISIAEGGTTANLTVPILP